MNKEILMLIFELLIRLFIIAVIPFGYKLIKKYNLEKAIKTTVFAAEQMLKEIDPDGSKRKEFVRTHIFSKFKIDENELNVLIEAAVKELNLIQKQLLPPEDALV